MIFNFAETAGILKWESLLKTRSISSKHWWTRVSSCNPFHLVFLSHIFLTNPSLCFHFWQLTSLLRKHSRFSFFSPSPICSCTWVNLFFLFFYFIYFIFFSVYDYILYIIYYILLDFWLLAEMNLQSHQLVSFLENVFFCLCLWNLVTFENHVKWGSCLISLIACLVGFWVYGSWDVEFWF